MSVTLTGDGTQPLALTTTGPSAGPATTPDVTAPVQALINSTVRIGTFLVADFTALTTLTGVQPNERIFVVGYGFYRYNQASSATVAAPVIINGHGGTGRFEWELMTAAGAASGLATLDAGGLVVQAGPNAIVDYIYAASNTSRTRGTGTTTFADIAGMNSTYTGCLIGDEFLIDYSLTAEATTDTGYVAVEITDGGTPTNDATTIAFIATSGVTPVFGSTIYTVVNAGSVRVALVFASSTVSGDVTVNSNPYQKLRTVRVRP